MAVGWGSAKEGACDSAIVELGSGSAYCEPRPRRRVTVISFSVHCLENIYTETKKFRAR